MNKLVPSWDVLDGPILYTVSVVEFKTRSGLAVPSLVFMKIISRSTSLELKHSVFIFKKLMLYVKN